MIETILAILGIHLLIGLIFAIPFVFAGAKKIDPSAIEGSWGFKLMIIPGAMVFWPLLLKRWLKKEAPPKESSYHRKTAAE